MEKSRKVTPQDVVDAAMPWSNESTGELESLRHRVEGLEKFCYALASVLTPAQQLAAVVQLRGGPTAYEGFNTVELTID